MKVTLRDGKEVEIRAGKVSDAANILDCMKQVIMETKNLAREPEEWKMTLEQEEDYLTKMENSPHQYMAIALDGDRVISTAGFQSSSLKRLQHRASLGISVLEEYHHRGLGTHMMNHLIAQARQMGKRILELDVRRDNPNAIQLYKNVGFHQEGIKEEAFFVDGKYIDLVLMSKYL